MKIFKIGIIFLCLFVLFRIVFPDNKKEIHVTSGEISWSKDGPAFPLQDYGGAIFNFDGKETITFKFDGKTYGDDENEQVNFWISDEDHVGVLYIQKNGKIQFSVTLSPNDTDIILRIYESISTVRSKKMKQPGGEEKQIRS